MDADKIVVLFDYNCWATDAVMNATEKLKDGQFSGKISCSHGSLRGILVHLLSAERIWRLRCQQGISPNQFIDESLFLMPTALWKRFRDEQAQMREYLSTLDSNTLESIVTYKTTKGEAFKNALWQILVHLFNHGTHHRSEIAEILTRYGRSPGDLDFITYLRGAAEQNHTKGQ